MIPVYIVSIVNTIHVEQQTSFSFLRDTHSMHSTKRYLRYIVDKIDLFVIVLYYIISHNN